MKDEAAKGRVEDVLRDDHRRIDVLGDQLLNLVHVGDAVAADRTYGDLERVILAHLEIEERHLLPLIERDRAEDAAIIRADHDKIRKLLGELGVGLELHAIREEVLEALSAFLKAHALREEGLLYKLAGEKLEEGPLAMILERLHLARPHRSAAR